MVMKRGCALLLSNIYAKEIIPFETAVFLSDLSVWN